MSNALCPLAAAVWVVDGGEINPCLPMGVVPVPDVNVFNLPPPAAVRVLPAIMWELSVKSQKSERVHKKKGGGVKTCEGEVRMGFSFSLF